STRMSAAARNSSAGLTVSTAPPLRTRATSAPLTLARRAPPRRGGQKVAEGAQPLADMVDHQPGGRRQPAVARHQDADAALRQPRFDQRHMHQFASADFVEEADRREESDAQP